MSYPGDPSSGDGPRYPPPDPAYQAPPTPEPFAPVDYPDLPPEYRPPSPPGATAGYGPPPPGSNPPFPGYPPPYPGYPPYGPGYPTYGPASAGPPGTNGKAIASIVCGVASLALCLCYLPALAAILLGGVALAEIRRTGQAGQGLAVGGIVLGGLSVLAGIFVWVSGGPAG